MPPFVPYKIGPDGVPFQDPNPVGSGMSPAAAALLGASPQATDPASALLGSNAPQSAGAMNVPSSSGDPNANLAALHALLSQSQSPAAMTDVSGFPTTPQATALEGQDAALQGQIGALSAASQTLQNPNTPFVNKLGQANDALAGAGVDPTKTIGGNTGAPDLTSRQSPADILAAGAAKGMGGDVGAVGLPDPKKRPMQNVGAREKLIGNSSGVTTAPGTPIMQQGPFVAGGTPGETRKPALDEQARRMLVFQKAQRASLGREGFSPEEAMGVQTQQRLMDSLIGGGGQGAGGNLALDMLAPGLGAANRENQKVANEGRAIDATNSNTQALRADQQQQKRFDAKRTYMAGGMSPKEAGERALIDVPVISAENSAQSAPQQPKAPIPPPPAAGNGNPLPPGGWNAPVHNGQPVDPVDALLPGINKQPVNETEPSAVDVGDAANSLGLGAAGHGNFDALATALQTHPEIMNRPKLLRGIANRFGITPDILNREELATNPYAHSNLGANSVIVSGLNTMRHAMLDNPGDQTAAANKLRILNMLRQAMGAKGPYTPFTGQKVSPGDYLNVAPGTMVGW